MAPTAAPPSERPSLSEVDHKLSFLAHILDKEHTPAPPPGPAPLRKRPLRPSEGDEEPLPPLVPSDSSSPASDNVPGQPAPRRSLPLSESFTYDAAFRKRRTEPPAPPPEPLPPELSQRDASANGGSGGGGGGGVLRALSVPLASPRARNGAEEEEDDEDNHGVVSASVLGSRSAGHISRLGTARDGSGPAAGALKTPRHGSNADQLPPEHVPRAGASEALDTGHKLLRAGEPELDRLAPNEVKYYRFDVPQGSNRLLVRIQRLGGEPDLYASFNWDFPSPARHHYRSTNEGEGELEITDEMPEFRPGPLFLAVMTADKRCEYRLTVRAASSLVLSQNKSVQGKVQANDPAYFRIQISDARQSVVFRLTLRPPPSGNAVELPEDSKPKIHVSTRYKFPGPTTSVWTAVFDYGEGELTLSVDPIDLHFRTGWYYACVEGPVEAHFRLLAFQRKYPADTRADRSEALRAVTVALNSGLILRVAAASGRANRAVTDTIPEDGVPDAALPSPPPARPALLRSAAFQSRPQLEPGGEAGPRPPALPPARSSFRRRSLAEIALPEEGPVEPPPAATPRAPPSGSLRRRSLAGAEAEAAPPASARAAPDSARGEGPPVRPPRRRSVAEIGEVPPAEPPPPPAAAASGPSSTRGLGRSATFTGTPRGGPPGGAVAAVLERLEARAQAGSWATEGEREVGVRAPLLEPHGL